METIIDLSDQWIRNILNKTETNLKNLQIMMLQNLRATVKLLMYFQFEFKLHCSVGISV